MRHLLQRLSARLFSELTSVELRGGEWIEVIVAHRGERAELSACGFETHSTGASPSWGRIRCENVARLADHPNVDAIDLAGSISLHLEAAIPEIRANEVWSTSPAGKGKGSGVVIGIVDTGIIPELNTFRTPSNQTRILAYWDPSPTLRPEASLNETQPPAPLNHGIQYLKADIDKNLPKPSIRMRVSDTLGHGSFVAQCAAGNGRGNVGQPPRFVGVAPEADLVVVVLQPQPSGAKSYTPGPLREALDYIFAIAHEQNKPAVVNLSWGEALTSADGMTPLDLEIDRALNDSSGKPIPRRAIVVSAGNEGNSHRHTTMMFNSNESLSVTILIDHPEKDSGYDEATEFMEIWYTGTASFDVSVENPGNLGTAGPVSPGNNAVTPRVVITSSAAVQSNGKRTLQIALKPKDGVMRRGAYRVLFKETSGHGGQMDLWINRKPNDLTATIVGWNNVRDNTVTSPASAKSAIAVGAYGVVVPTDTNYRMLGTSSWGPDDGLVAPASRKPTITAPGIISAMSVGTETEVDTYIVRIGKVVLKWGGYSVSRVWGTSFAAPLVTGVVALMFERKPTLTWKQITEILQQTARRNYIPPTTTLPNNAWGAGHIDARAAVEKAAQLP